MIKLPLLVTLLAMISCNTFAQDTDHNSGDMAYYQEAGYIKGLKKLQFGIRVGAGLANQSYKSTNNVQSESINTLNAALTVRLPLSKRYFIRTGVGITGKGGTIIEDALTTTTRITYLRVPLNMATQFTVNQLGNIYLGLGGYLGRGLYGKYKYQTPGSEVQEKIKFGKDNDIPKADAGLNFITGLEIDNHLTFNISYDLGLNNLTTNTLKEIGVSRVKNRCFSIALGYLFK